MAQICFKTPDQKEKDFVFRLAYAAFSSPLSWKTIGDCERSLDPWFTDPVFRLGLAYEQDPVAFSFLRYCSPRIAEEYEILGGSFLQLQPAPCIASLDMLAVEEGFRRRGFGEILLRSVVEDARNQGISRLYALCYGAAQGQSLGLFLKNGFLKVIDHPRAYVDGSPGTLVVCDLL